ncbi:MAG: GTP cyclohydrolase II RibA [Alphaproteobacteria bacterium]|nr:GTP cyclohydrolase II RibA [Alphaproteobacteria bacterium]
MSNKSKNNDVGNSTSSKAKAVQRGAVIVERAISELRSGRPVAIRSGRTYAIAAGIEALDTGFAEQLWRNAKQTPRLVLAAPRLRRLGLDRKLDGAFAMPTIDFTRIENLSFETGARFDAPVAKLGKLDAAALELTRLAFILPAIVTVQASSAFVASLDLIEVEPADIHRYIDDRVVSLKIVSRARVPLEDGVESEFVVFRGGQGLRDQVAVIVGKPDHAEPVSVRLHSACLTGDLFGSMKCDCGDQLRHTVKFMAENGGGVLLYLDQEGRGNGLSNKIRAYRLQAEGFDTYDADEIIGFDHDQRRFDFAAQMLVQLGISQVRVLTNNPEKMAALENAGIQIVADQRIIGRLNDHNIRYLTSKRDRAGHFIDANIDEALAANIEKPAG